MEENEKRKKSILIVEDEPHIIDFLIGLLSTVYEVEIVCDGKSALARIMNGARQVDLIVIDYRLPDISGLEVLREVKKVRPQVPALFITGYGDEEVAVKAFRYGARDYFKKPFSYDECVKKIEFFLSLKEPTSSSPRKVLTDDIEKITDQLLQTVNPVSPNIQKALSYIDLNYISRISLQKAAAKACMSKYHFSREFKKSIGCTFQDYLNRVRIEKAKELLKKTDTSITAVAFSVGYTDLTGFERTFKRMTGCTPVQYKKSVPMKEIA